MKKISIISRIIIVTVLFSLVLSGCSMPMPDDGLSAYEIAVKNGFTGTESEWLSSLNGKDGNDGVDGQDGKDGKDGQNGQDGVGISDIYVDENGDLIVTLTNGRVINAGKIVSNEESDHFDESFTAVDPQTMYAFSTDISKATVYSKPDGSSAIATLEIGTAVERNGVSDELDYSRIKYNGKTAYIKNANLTFNRFEKYIVSTEIYVTDDNDNHLPGKDCNIYSDDNFNSRTGTAKDGNSATVLAVHYQNHPEDNYGWSYISYNGSFYFIRNSQLKCYLTNADDQPPRDIYEYDASLVPSGMSGMIPIDLSQSSKGQDHIKNETSLTLDISALSSIKVSSAVASQDPLVLIIHTHGTESFAENGSFYFDPRKEAPRSTDSSKNVISLGKTVANILNQKGIPTYHCEITFDRLSDTDYSGYNLAYARAEEKIKELLAEYPSIKYVLDIHRDSISKESTGERYKPIIETDNGVSAQVMFVVASGSADVQCPNWESNLALAQAVRKELDKEAPGICRPTLLRGKTYNQQYADFSMLLEVGSDCNTLEEVQLAASLAANAIAKVIIG